MTYGFDGKAHDEAADNPAAAETIARLQHLCQAKADALGPARVRAHTVTYIPAAWGEVGLSDGAGKTGQISRGDLLDIGRKVREGISPATELFLASFVWGWGTTGYGPSRLRGVLGAAGESLETSLQRALAAASEEPGQPDPIAGYAYLYGGWISDDSDKRAAPGSLAWARLRGYGPAFFTKFLYFAVPGALILDNRLASAVSDLSSMPNLVTSDGRSWPWTPYRYAVYLHWMRQTADAVGIEPELLEVTLFEPPGEIADERDAAD